LPSTTFKRQGESLNIWNRKIPGIEKSLKIDRSEMDKGNRPDDFAGDDIKNKAPPPESPVPGNNRKFKRILLLDAGFVFTWLK